MANSIHQKAGISAMAAVLLIQIKKKCLFLLEDFSVWILK